MANLKTNYKNSEYAGKKKYRMINNSDGTVSFEDVTEYTTVGDDYSADEINQANTVVNDFSSNGVFFNGEISNDEVSVKNYDGTKNITIVGKTKFDEMERNKSQVTDINGNTLLTVPMTPPMNLLVNGDFKVNQRGLDSYGDGLDGWKYTVDMWKVYKAKVSTVNKKMRVFVENGKDGYFQQDFTKKINGNFTITVKINEVSRGRLQCYLLDEGGNSQGTIETTSAGIFIKVCKNTKNVNRFRFYLDDFDGVIEYVMIYNGEIAYPHIEEDYAIALTRCQQYLVCIKRSDDINFPIIGYNVIYDKVAPSIATNKYRMFCNFKTNLIKKPTIITKNLTVYFTNNFSLNIESGTIYNFSKGYLTLLFYINSESDIVNRSGNIWIYDELLLSCEPL